MKVLWGHEPSKPSSGKESGMFSGSTPEEYGILCLKLYLLLVCLKKNRLPAGKYQNNKWPDAWRCRTYVATRKVGSIIFS
jgi:hypothetical protein